MGELGEFQCSGSEQHLWARRWTAQQYPLVDHQTRVSPVSPQRPIRQEKINRSQLQI